MGCHSFLRRSTGKLLELLSTRLAPIKLSSLTMSVNLSDLAVQARRKNLFNKTWVKQPAVRPLLRVLPIPL